MQKLAILFGLLMYFQLSTAQDLKILSSQDFNQWKNITQTQISDDGKFVVYQTSGDDTDPDVRLYDVAKKQESLFPYYERPSLTEDGRLLAMSKKIPLDSLKQLKRQKVKKDDLPKDSLVILVPGTNQRWAFYNVSKNEMPQKLHDLVIIQPALPNYKKDSIATARDYKKQSEDNGRDLIIWKPLSGMSDTIRYVKKHAMAKEAYELFYWTTGPDSASQHTLIRYHIPTKKSDTIAIGSWKDAQLFCDKAGMQCSALINADSTDYKEGPRKLIYYNVQTGKASFPELGDHVLPSKWHIPPYSKVEYREGTDELLVGISPRLLSKDTTLLDEEIVNVEVWHTEDDYLYTMQESRLEQTKKQTFRVLYRPATNQFIPLENQEMEEAVFGHEEKGKYALLLEKTPFKKEITWQGGNRMNVWLTNLSTGDKSKLLSEVWEEPRLSPNAEHMVWYDRDKMSWHFRQLPGGTTINIEKPEGITWSDEQNDIPALPRAYGLAGWLEGEKGILLYDRYDIWQVDFAGKGTVRRLTRGRENQKVHRIVNTRGESPYTSDKRLYLKVFDELNKSSGYSLLELGKNPHLMALEYGNFELAERWTYTPDLKHILFTKESFTMFPDLLLTSDMFDTSTKVSDVNPQQKAYAWGSIELINWTNPAGEKLQGLVVKPAGFDPNKKYPLLINFYERSSDGLYTYRAPLAGRSSINYSYYASKGYAIFNPDITYKDGYPGESCYEDLMSGVDAVLELGFVDSTKMGLQGHSWGGYQVAYLLGRTDRFACAESGAPVVNMTSAYGGIRWESGMSRMFQYEKTQSRIGKTLWEDKELYLENSPLFTLPNVKTPVLILHNDEDGAVPWYQGIEYFVGLRRLGKQAWLLNYNGEPHWPVKYQNRKDFNIRMEQFFDHFLMAKPMPEWMKKGVPAIEKGINLGY